MRPLFLPYRCLKEATALAGHWHANSTTPYRENSGVDHHWLCDSIGLMLEFVYFIYLYALLFHCHDLLLRLRYRS